MKGFSSIKFANHHEIKIKLKIIKNRAADPIRVAVNMSERRRRLHLLKRIDNQWLILTLTIICFFKIIECN